MDVDDDQEGIPNSTNTNGLNIPHEPTENSTLTALFGWEISPLAASSSRKSTSSSHVPESAQPSAPSTPRRVPRSVTEFSTPSPGPSRFNFSSLTTSFSKVPEDRPKILSCHLCMQRVGLWSFKPQDALPSSATDTPSRRTFSRRQFDLLREHRPYCPYVVRTTPVPSLWSSSPVRESQNLTRSQSTRTLNLPFPGKKASTTKVEEVQELHEGWRAVLSVILRAKFARRMRQQSFVRQSTSSTSTNTGAVDDEEQAIHAMVEDVKHYGVSLQKNDFTFESLIFSQSRHLMDYVRGLFT